MERENFVLLRPREFNETNLVIDPPKEIRYTNTIISVVKSSISYKGSDGKIKKLWIRFPKQKSFGVDYNHELNIPKQNRTPENCSGYQTMYQLTSLDTVKNPSSEESESISFLGKWREIIYKNFLSLSPDDKKSIPKIAKSFLENVKMDAVKPPFSKPLMTDPTDKSSENKVEDETKPYRMYIKLLVSGKERKIVSSIFGTDGERLMPQDFIKKFGYIEPVVHFDSIYWGGHGQHSFYGASLQLRIIQAVFEPIESSLPRECLISHDENIEEIDETNVFKQDSSVQITEGDDSIIDKMVKASVEDKQRTSEEQKKISNSRGKHSKK